MARPPLGLRMMRAKEDACTAVPAAWMVVSYIGGSPLLSVEDYLRTMAAQATGRMRGVASSDDQVSVLLYSTYLPSTV